jgi:hypothetical protein
MSGHVAAMASRQACRGMAADCHRQPAGNSSSAGHKACWPWSLTTTAKAFRVVFPGSLTAATNAFFLGNVPYRLDPENASCRVNSFPRQAQLTPSAVAGLENQQKVEELPGIL